MSETPNFLPGDKVLVNGNLVAEIETFDVENNVVRYVSTAGGGTDTTTGHISQTRIEHLIQPPVGSDTRPEAPQAEELPLEVEEEPVVKVAK